MRVTIKSEIYSIKDKLFKSTAYDIRAYVGEIGNFFQSSAVLTPEAMEIAGVLMGSLVFKCENGDNVSLLPGDSVVIGYDNGPTSKELADAFSKGLTSQGINVLNVGIASSGQVYHNQYQLDAQGHVQITRSHVEVTTNGAKFGIGSQGIHTYLLNQMNEAISKGEIGREVPAGKIIDKSKEGYDLYREKMIERYKSYFEANPRKIAVNLFGGTGVKYRSLFQAIFGNEVTILGDRVDVNSGKILADPTRIEMLKKVPGLKEALQKGLRVHSFDLDADRGSITEGENALEVNGTGHYMGDALSYLIADYKLSICVPKLLMALSEESIPSENLDKIHQIATTIFVDPRYTGSIKAFVSSLGGNTIYHRKGHSLWKETMLNNMNEICKLANCVDNYEFMKISDHYRDIQIEASLHLFATDPEDGLPKDDAIENVFILEMILDKLGITKLADYFSKISRRFTTKEIRTTCVSSEIKEKITYRVIDIMKKTFSDDMFLKVEFDGQIRVEWNTGFVMYGMSNTSPKLTMMAEGSTEQERNQALAYVLSLHNAAKKEYGDDLPMDLVENSFFINDKSYDIEKPDDIDANDNRVIRFKNTLKVG